MQTHDDPGPVRRMEWGLDELGVAAGLLLGAALMPAAAAIVLVTSRRARRAAVDPFLSRLGYVASGRVAVGWAAGFALLAVGQAFGAADGAMSMLNGAGLAFHTAFALCGEVVMLAATIAIARRRCGPAAGVEA